MNMQYQIRKVAFHNNLNKFDLEYAVKTIQCNEDNRTMESITYKTLIVSDSKQLWDVAKEVLEKLQEGNK